MYKHAVRSRMSYIQSLIHQNNINFISFVDLDTQKTVSNFVLRDQPSGITSFTTNLGFSAH